MAYLSRNYAPEGKELERLLRRSSETTSTVQRAVADILCRVASGGDAALFALEKQFTKADHSSLLVSPEEFLKADELVPASLKHALAEAYKNIRAFHEIQLPEGEKLTVSEGIELSRKIVPIQRVGLYVPGGTAPLISTTLMLGIPAQVAGCPDVVLCTPSDARGKVHPAILYAASMCNITRVFKLGGAQAIAAMAYGSESVPKVDKIFGPGNQYVTEAKKQVSTSCCAIDMPAGPSEVMVVATVDADPAFVASDLLSQAEHGMDSQSMLVILGDKESGFAFLDRVEEQLSLQLEVLDRQSFLLSSLSHSHAFVCPTLAMAAKVVNDYAPEHLIINTTDPSELEALVVNAGSIFLGPYSCESAGDYASGTNHTLPTNGWAHSYSGVSTDSFLKKITVQKLSLQGLVGLSTTLVTLAEAERLTAHRNAVLIRLGGVK
ncbi:MAG TPA: histidinol dehydrogenase [Sphaerochaeta sp.]|nr:histidinol dehydrogenase [Sphaerochaeta sp.]